MTLKGLDPGLVMERILDQLTPAQPPAYAPQLGPCTMWSGPTNDAGYAILWIGRKKKLFVARWLYEHVISPIPPGMEPDHLCHDPDYCTPGPTCPHRRCCDLAHLEAVTRRENTIRSGAPPGVNARKVFCENGHDITDPANVYVRPSRPQERECIKCRIKRRTNLARVQREFARRSIKTAGGTGQQMSLLGD